MTATAPRNPLHVMGETDFARYFGATMANLASTTVLPAAQKIVATDAGGYCQVFYCDPNAPNDYAPCFGFRLGKGTAVQFGEWFSHAIDKGWRLNKWPEHCSAWESRDLRWEVKHWAGGFRFGPFIVTFSGLAEHFDEMLILLTAVAVGLTTKERARELAAISNNTHYLELAATLESEGRFPFAA
ncbi:MAG: hypothetical protein AAB865_01200 [Patescibacteria group bacterium]